MSSKNTENLNQELKRRTFLKGLILILNALIAIMLAIPGLGYILTPILHRDEQIWIKVGRVGDIQAGAFTRTDFRYVSSSGYVRKEKSAFVWMRQEVNGEFTAFSPTCTHMGCNVSWNSSSDRFECPCHGGMYDEQGNVIAGPPPKPMQRYQIRVENNNLYLQKTEA